MLPTIISRVFLIALILGSTNSRHPVASVVRIDKIECLSGAGLRLNLHINVRNPSREPLSLARVSIARERFYRVNSSGKLVVIATSHGPDLIVGFDPFAPQDVDVKQETLAPGANKVFTFNHILYLIPLNAVVDGRGSEVVVSFDVANVPKSGHTFEYWTAPVVIRIPKNCRIS